MASPPVDRELPDNVRLTPPVTEDAHVPMARRVRPMIGLTFVAWALYTVIGVVVGSWPLIVINGFGALSAGGFYLALPARPRLARFAAHALCAVAVTCVLVSSLVSGYTSSPALLYLATVPVAVGYLLGRREAALWAALCVACALAVAILGRLHPVEPLFLTTPPLVVFNLFIVIVVVMALVNTAMRLNEQHVQELEQRETTIRDLLTGLQMQKGELLHARDRAIAASRAKSEFVATVSHEIRTPLNGVLGMAGLLLDEELSPGQRELVGTIRLSGDALLAIINDILDFSKIEAGKLELETAPFDLREHVQDAVDLFSAAAAKKGLKLTATLTDSTPLRVLGDGARFRQILVNLLGNAVKFTDHGEIAVLVSARPLDETREGEGLFEIACSVKDTGIGIPADRLAALFVPFSQVDPSTTRRFGGTGLGLAISQRLAVAMGGVMSVESTLGEGSTFTFTLRAEQQRSSRGGASDVGTPSPSRLPLIGAELPLRVLVAEDNPINQRVASLLLERLGYRADVVGNGVEAIDALAARPYDLVLMDVRMPEMDGIAATRRLRADLPANRQPRIVAMTANATVEDREACRAAGMDDFLSKPVRPAELIRVLRGSRASVRAAPEPESALDPSAFASLREIVDGVPGALRDMVSQYHTTGDDLIEAVSEALSKRDCKALRQAAHSLKGASAQMGARQVAAAALRIEKAAAAEDADGAGVLLPALRSAQDVAVPLLVAACDEAQPVSRRGWDRAT